MRLLRIVGWLFLLVALVETAGSMNTAAREQFTSAAAGEPADESSFTMRLAKQALLFFKSSDSESPRRHRKTIDSDLPAIGITRLPSQQSDVTQLSDDIRSRARGQHYVPPLVNMNSPQSPVINFKKARKP